MLSDNSAGITNVVILKYQFSCWAYNCIFTMIIIYVIKLKLVEPKFVE
jgi:hypothetical protein